MWLDSLLDKLPVDKPQVINDSKTPSGRVHVGSLRGVLIHDAVLRALQERGTPVRFLYGIDDYDPMDGLPANAPGSLREHMGEPLCAVVGAVATGGDTPSPAERNTREFTDLFKPLGVDADIYHTADMYRNGDFNKAIEMTLNNADTVREIYFEISGAERADNWFPFQMICEKCGKIGTTSVLAWNGKEATYRCEPALVKWAQGCGHEGTASPFDGRGKLPWKLEWAAKWYILGVTIEGAGKDHCTKGGSRDIASACMRRIYKAEPPLNIPYEFFLVDGSKMSSSHGIGESARDIADFLPPDNLRFLMLRSPPNKTVNFSTKLDYIARLFNEYDELTQKETAENIQMLKLASPDHQAVAPQLPPFQLLVALAQLPHINIEDEVIRRGGLLSKPDVARLRARIAAVRYWLEQFAEESDKTTLCSKLPASAEKMAPAQKAFLHALAYALPRNGGDEQSMQALVFETARMTPLPAKDAFAGIYTSLFDSTHGPRAGAVLAWLDYDVLFKRFTEIPLPIKSWWNDTAISVEDTLNRLKENADATQPLQLDLRCDNETHLYALEITALKQDSKRFLLRIAIDAETGDDARKKAEALHAQLTAGGFKADALATHDRPLAFASPR